MHVVAPQSISAVSGRAGQRIAVCGSVDVESAPALRTAGLGCPRSYLDAHRRACLNRAGEVIDIELAEHISGQQQTSETGAVKSRVWEIGRNSFRGSKDIAFRVSGIAFDAVVSIEISEEEILRRMNGRRVCEACGSSYNVVSIPPRVEGICDNCGGKLIQRKDDTPETVRERLKVYHTETEPLVDFYAARGLLRPVRSDDTKEGTTQAILAALGIEK